GSRRVAERRWRGPSRPSLPNTGKLEAGPDRRSARSAATRFDRGRLRIEDPAGENDLDRCVTREKDRGLGESSRPGRWNPDRPAPGRAFVWLRRATRNVT